MLKTALTKGHGHSNTFPHACNEIWQVHFFYHIYNIYYRTPPLPPQNKKNIYLLYK